MWYSTNKLKENNQRMMSDIKKIKDIVNELSFKSKKIIVCDDDVIDLKKVNRQLSKKGYVVRTTSDPYKAIEIAKNEDHGLMIIDVNIPQMNGFELAENIIDIEICKVFLTGQNIDENLSKKARELGCYIISKDNVDLLLNTISSVMEEGQFNGV